MSNNKNKKQRLLIAAHTLFLSDGYNGVKVDTICATAHTAKGTFFYYFPTKQAIVFELLDQQLHDLSLTIANRIFALPGTSLDRLNHFIEYLLSPLALTPEAVKYFDLFHLPLWFESQVRLLRHQYFFPIFNELIQCGKNESLFNVLNTRTLSEILYTGIERYIHDHRYQLDDVIALQHTMSAIKELIEKTLCLTDGSITLSCY